MFLNNTVTNFTHTFVSYLIFKNFFKRGLKSPTRQYLSSNGNVIEFPSILKIYARLKKEEKNSPE